jgi:hypothetical protein
MTACHNPACTVQTIEETGSHFLPARETPIVSSSCPSPCSWTRLPKVGAELSAAGEWSREDLARQDRCTGAADPLQRAQQFSLPLDRGILRIGGIAFLLDNAKLGLDQLKTMVFPFKFATQAFGKRPALGGGQLAEINSSAPPLRLDPANAWAKSSPLMRLVWPVRSRTRRWRSRWERRASSFDQALSASGSPMVTMA